LDWHSLLHCRAQQRRIFENDATTLIKATTLSESVSNLEKQTHTFARLFFTRVSFKAYGYGFEGCG
jgi:hypothetical protein